MIKKKIGEILHGKIEIRKFNEIQKEGDRVYKIKLQNEKNESSNLYCLKNVRIVQSGNTCFSVLKDNYLIEELCFQSKSLVRKDLSINKVLSNGYISFFPKKIKGTSFCLLQDIAQKLNYFHFLYDCIVKLHLIEEFKEIEYDNVLIPSKKMNFQKQIIQALNLKKKVIDCDGIKIIDLEKLIIVDHPYWKENNLWFDDISNIPEWSVKFLRNKFLSLESSKKFKNKIFIDRSDSTSPYNQIDNNTEVKEFLEKNGFEILQFTSLSFSEQVKAFKNADIIIGGHGSAFANLAFCKPNAKLIELRQKDHPVSLNKISKINSVNHKVWLIDTNKNGKMPVNLEELKDLLS